MREYYTKPILVDVCITNRCNLSCDYCSAESGPFASKKGEITASRLATLFQEFDLNKVPRVALTGGEPFMREDILDILSEFNKYKFAKILNTNGNLIREKHALALSQLNLDRICITLDGSTSEIHDSARGKGSFKKAIEGIRQLQKYNLPVSTLFTLGKHNVNDLINTIKLNDKLNIDFMSVMVLCPTGRANDTSVLTDKENWYPVFLELSKKIKNKDFKVNFKIVPPNESDVFWTHYFPLEYYDRLDLLEVWGVTPEQYMNRTERDISCQAGIKACSISDQGDVYGCDLMNGIEELIAGNINDSKFMDIWNDSPIFNKFRTMKFSDLSGKCSICPHTWCGGGCRCSALELDGTLLGSDLSCFYEPMEGELC